MDPLEGLQKCEDITTFFPMNMLEKKIFKKFQPLHLLSNYQQKKNIFYFGKRNNINFWSWEKSVESMKKKPKHWQLLISINLVTEQLGLEWTFGGHVIQNPLLKQSP